MSLRELFTEKEKPVVDPTPTIHPDGSPNPLATLADPPVATGPIEEDFSAVLTALEKTFPALHPVVTSARWFTHLIAPTFRAALAAGGYKIVKA